MNPEKLCKSFCFFVLARKIEQNIEGMLEIDKYDLNI